MARCSQYTSEDVITLLNLEPLTVEGGYFNETYRSQIKAADGSHTCGTCIYYLLKGKDISDWHKVESDEIWLYHAGTPAIQLLLYPDGTWEERIIGPDLSAGQRPQSIIPAGTWQAAALLDRNPAEWGLFGAAVFPAFEYADFTAQKGSVLAEKYSSATPRMTELGLL
jgi:predicted cupin superfamily sugar epimerase